MPTVAQATAKTKAKIASKQTSSKSVYTAADGSRHNTSSQANADRLAVDKASEAGPRGTRTPTRTSGGVTTVTGPTLDYGDGTGTPTVKDSNGFEEQTPAGVPGAPAAPVEGLPGAPAPTGVSTVPTPPPPVSTPGAAPTPTQNKYQQGLNTALGGGIPAPQDAGAARSMTATYTPQQQDTTAVDQFISDDPAINTLMAGITQLLNPAKQASTLMQDYKKLYKQSGLDEINEELIDANTVIEGTEDDIRNEIQTAGGFGTESQVQAMSLARNKGLLKRYNQLVQMKTDATNQLNTLSSLNAQDKQIAQQRVDSQISTMFNMANFRQQATNNSRQQYQWMATQMGADGLYNSLAKDPRQLAFAEKILGTSPGGLQQLAAQAATDRANVASDRALDRQYKVAQINNLNAPKAVTAKPSTGLEKGSLAFFNRAFNATKDVAGVEAGFASNPGKAAGLNLWGILQTSEQKAYKQAQRTFTEARLRKESGAAIPDDEYKSDSETYFVQPGDGAAEIAQKQRARAEVLEGIRFGAGNAYKEFYGEDAVDNIKVGGQTYYVGQIVTNAEGQTGIVLPDGSIEAR